MTISLIRDLFLTLRECFSLLMLGLPGVCRNISGDVEVCRISHVIFYFIYSCTYESRTLARLQRVPCLYHFVSAAAKFQHKRAGITQNPILASRCQRDTRPSYENALTTNETTSQATRTLRLQPRPVELRERSTTTTYDETPSLIYPSTLTTHSLTRRHDRVDSELTWRGIQEMIVDVEEE